MWCRTGYSSTLLTHAMWLHQMSPSLSHECNDPKHSRHALHERTTTIPSHFTPGTVGQNAFQAVAINQPVINLIIAALRRRGSGHRSVARGVARALGGCCQVTGAPEPPARPPGIMPGVREPEVDLRQGKAPKCTLAPPQTLRRVPILLSAPRTGLS